MSTRTLKYSTVTSWLRAGIESGRFSPGTRLPREADLMSRFGVSRITVTRAMRDLQDAGLVTRRVGAGSFVAHRPKDAGLSFGLLIPDLGDTDIFEPICRAMMASPRARDHALLWGGAAGGASAGDRARQLCRQFIDRGVTGVFFAPLERGQERHVINREILRALDDSGTPVVLLDRTADPYPEPGRHDLVALDHHLAAFTTTRHLARQGCRRLAFVGPRETASSVDAREAGYREAVVHHGNGIAPVVSRYDGPVDAALAALAGEHRPDGIVCANDRTAGEVARALSALPLRVPDDVRLVGIDDVGYAELLPVPLTTYRQPVDALGAVALAAMLERVTHDGPPRHTLLHGELVVRASCGHHAV